ncbi:tyrosinase cofactor [Streptomyces sp. NPDC005805]|uniref:tyrosinase cofactor n=1 Tax=Streptomyces sp. NPDC005805 TaxID=3157068 RepID=UPI0033DF8833
MSRLTRRRALGAAGAAAGLAVVGAAAGTARSSSAPRPRTPAGPPVFDEVYLGRRIQGAPAPTGGGHHDHHAAHGAGHTGHGTTGHGTGHTGHGDGYRVHVDGDELHVMRNADGTWISVVNHYETFRTPRDVARAAVRELQGSDLVPLDLSS